MTDLAVAVSITIDAWADVVPNSIIELTPVTMTAGEQLWLQGRIVSKFTDPPGRTWPSLAAPRLSCMTQADLTAYQASGVIPAGGVWTYNNLEVADTGGKIAENRMLFTAPTSDDYVPVLEAMCGSDVEYHGYTVEIMTVKDISLEPTYLTATAVTPTIADQWELDSNVAVAAGGVGWVLAQEVALPEARDDFTAYADANFTMDDGVGTVYTRIHAIQLDVNGSYHALTSSDWVIATVTFAEHHAKAANSVLVADDVGGVDDFLVFLEVRSVSGSGLRIEGTAFVFPATDPDPSEMTIAFVQ